MNTSETPTRPLLTRTLIVCLTAMLCCFLWGSAFPCIKIGYRLFAIDSADTGSQILFAGVRFTLAGLLVILLGSLTTRRLLLPKKESLPSVLKLSMLQTVIQYLLFYIGLAHTTGVKSSIIEASNVFFAILVASLIFRYEKFTRQKLLGCIAGFAGVVLINMGGGSALDLHMSISGEGAILLSALSASFSAVLIKKYSQKENPVVLSGYQFLLGGIVMSIFGITAGGRLQNFTISSVLLLLYMAVISAVAYTLWGLLLKYNPVSKISVYGFMNPVCGVILSALLLHEKNQAFSLVGLISLVLVCIGIYIVNRKEN
ncbi:MAG: DMT family transporter [Lachnospiraceae bacterium]|nr:DMT family transporter [Lachnospiraceae bacterium]